MPVIDSLPTLPVWYSALYLKLYKTMQRIPICMKPVPISMLPQMKEDAKTEAYRNNESLAAYIRRLIDADLKRNK